jgi:hypothetical protein
MGVTVDQRPERRRAGALVWVGVAAAVLVAAAGFAIGRHHTTGSAAGSAAGGSTAPVLAWAVDGPWPVPRSVIDGPTRLSAGSSGVPVGYAHDGLGAALAAFNITQQLTSDVGTGMAAVTIRTQTYGDATSTMTMVETTPTGGSTPPTELFYKVIGGDPTSDRVVLALAERTVESTAAGGFFVTDRELRWIGGDWRMGLPEPGAVVAGELPGFISLGGPPHV